MRRQLRLRIIANNAVDRQRRTTCATTRPISIFREFLDSEAAGGIILMVAAALALIVANSPLAETYFAALHAYLGPLSVSHWINDGLMAVFFLLVGLEIKREMLDGQLSTWPRRVLPGVAAAGGMLVPALIYVAINRNNAAALSGWAIPTATDIAFALGVLSLLGSRVPASLKIFLTALAIIDDLGAVIIIAIFYTSGLSLAYLGAAFAVIAVLIVLNRMRVTTLLPYLVLGAILWVLVLKSGVHATLAGVALALTIPLEALARQRPRSRPFAAAPARARPAQDRAVLRHPDLRLCQCRRVARRPERRRSGRAADAGRRRRPGRSASWSACSARRRLPSGSASPTCRSMPAGCTWSAFRCSAASASP